MNVKRINGWRRRIKDAKDQRWTNKAQTRERRKMNYHHQRWRRRRRRSSLTRWLAGWLIRRQHSTRPLSQKLNRSNGEEIKSGDQFMCKTTKNVDVQIQDTDDAIQRHSMKMQKHRKKGQGEKNCKIYS